MVKIVTSAKTAESMGRAKKRKLLKTWAPNSVDGISNVEVTSKSAPVTVGIAKSQMTGKWLAIAYILGEMAAISAHSRKTDARAASSEVFQKFNLFPVEGWRRYIAGDLTEFKQAILLLDYEDDDEILRVQLSIDGHRLLDSSQSTIELITNRVNRFFLAQTGKLLFRVKPGSWRDNHPKTRQIRYYTTEEVESEPSGDGLPDFVICEQFVAEGDLVVVRNQMASELDYDLVRDKCEQIANLIENAYQWEAQTPTLSFPSVGSSKLAELKMAHQRLSSHFPEWRIEATRHPEMGFWLTEVSRY